MKYRIMQIGDKFAAQIVGHDNKPGDYIDRQGNETWSSANLVLIRCVCDNIEKAKYAGDTYIKPFNDLAAAKEVTP